MIRLLYILSFALLLGVLIPEEKDSIQKTSVVDSTFYFELNSQSAEYEGFAILCSTFEILVDEEEESLTKASNLFEYSFNRNIDFCLSSNSVQPRKNSLSYNTILFVADSSPPLS